MKRFVIGTVLLILLLLGGILTARILHADFEPMVQELRQAAQEAGKGNWSHADRFYRLAHKKWQYSWKLTAVFTDHSPMEQIDGLFARLEVYRQARSAPSFRALCLQLAQEISELGEDHRPTWWNFL